MSDSVLKQELPTLEDGKPKDFVLARHPEASCFQTNTFWPGQGERKGVWIVTRRMIDSMSYASGATEEEAWYRAANRTLAECYRESMAESAALRAEIANLTLLSDSQLANQERLTEELAVARGVLADIPEQYQGQRQFHIEQKEDEVSVLRAELATEKKNHTIAVQAHVIAVERGEAWEAELATERANQERLVGEKWIDCKQELPPRSRVLAYFPSESTSVMDALFNGADFHVDGFIRTKAVTHWMKLPDPPALLAPKDTPTEPKSAPEEE